MKEDRILKRREVVFTGTEHVIKRIIDSFCQSEQLKLLDYAFEPDQADNEVTKFHAISEAMAEKWGRHSIERAQCDLVMAKYIIKPAIRFLKRASSKTSKG